jgi:hypothetical protein
MTFFIPNLTFPPPIPTGVCSNIYINQAFIFSTSFSSSYSFISILDPLYEKYYILLSLFFLFNINFVFSYKKPKNKKWNRHIR